MWYVNVDGVDIINLFDVVLNDIEIRFNCNFVSNNSNT